MTARRSVTEAEVPLYLIPAVIARQIKKRGNAVYRISVKRTHWHHYNISVRTKSLPRELRPGCGRVPPYPEEPANPSTGGNRDGDAGGAV